MIEIENKELGQLFFDISDLVDLKIYEGMQSVYFANYQGVTPPKIYFSANKQRYPKNTLRAWLEWKKVGKKERGEPPCITEESLVDLMKDLPPYLKRNNLVEIGLFPTAVAVYKCDSKGDGIKRIEMSERRVLYTKEDVVEWVINNWKMSDENKRRRKV